MNLRTSSEISQIEVNDCVLQPWDHEQFVSHRNQGYAWERNAASVYKTANMNSAVRESVSMESFLLRGWSLNPRKGTLSSTVST